MDKRQRVGLQRALAQEALGKLNAVTELFGIEDHATAGEKEVNEMIAFQAELEEFEKWLFSESPLA